MNKKILIIGASGHGKVVADAIIKSGDIVTGFLDDDASTWGQSVVGFPVLGSLEEYVHYPDHAFVIAIGNAMIREAIAQKLAGVRWHTVIHPSAIVAGLDVSIGEGTVLLANSVVNAGTHIGRHCIINTGAIVEHDNCIADFAHISVGARLAGTVTIGHHTWVGIGAIVKNNLSVCENSMLGAGCVVVKDITESGTYIGVPAVKIQMNCGTKGAVSQTAEKKAGE